MCFLLCRCPQAKTFPSLIKLVRCGGPNLRASQHYPTAFAARVAALGCGAAELVVVLPKGMPDQQLLSEDWRDGDMDRVAGFLRRAFKERPWL